MKKKIFAVVISVALVLSVALLAGCSDKNPVKETATLEQAQVSSPTVKSGEVVSVTPDAAIDTALNHAGVAREDAVLFGTPELDEENGKPHYDIDFGYNGFEYDYEIAVVDGAILKAEKEAERIPEKATEKAPETVTEKVDDALNENPPETTKAPVSNNGYISVEAAKQKALENAGVKADAAVFLKAYYDSDDIVPHYDIKFESNGYEYEYEIKASDGSVLEKDVDREGRAANTSSVPKEYISEEEAKSTAFNHASVNAADVKFSKAALDRDDLIVHYDVEFVAGGYEYDYEINAETGKVIAFDKDYND